MKWRINQRPPQIGDIGAIVEILQVTNLLTAYVVECSNQDGTAVWVSEFFAEEIAAI
jgi:hypothetical protein